VQNLTQQRWQISPPISADSLAQRLRYKLVSRAHGGGGSTEQPDISPLLIQLLHNRGITDPTQFDAFLAADERLANDPFLLQEMDKAVTRVLRALLGDELVAVYGDFDADGITAAVLLAQGIQELGGRVISYIPHRFDEGHGLNLTALKNLKKQGVSLVVTVDCGITGVSEVEEGHKLGLDIIVTDHHVPLAHIPPALAAIDPKLTDSNYPFYDLAGVGVAFKLLQALYQATNRGSEWEKFLDLVALGTVVDMVPLLGENRYLVRRGIEELNQSPRPGVRELVLCAGLEIGGIDSDSISYALGPRLNASGRMDHAVTSYELLTTTSQAQARALAAQLEARNAERQKLTAEVLAKAREKLLSEGIDQPLLMIGGHDYPHGVLGVVAGKLVDEFYRPVVVLKLDGESVKGSARSIPAFDIVAALAECRDLLTRFGGHSQAAGFVTPRANVERLQRQLQGIAARELADADLRPALIIDCVLPLSSLGREIHRMLSRLAPFGQGNQEPVFLSEKVKVVDSRIVGGSGKHLKLKLRDGQVVWDAIAFDLGDRELSTYLDIVYNLKADHWNGREQLRLNVLDFLPLA
jgi:single-stranded-DNA-specific exonuclease